MWFFRGLLVLCASIPQLAAGDAARLLTVPAIQFKQTSGTLSLGSLTSIVVDSRYQSAVDLNGETLIPPSLQDFAGTFANDLGLTAGLNLNVSFGNAATPGSIFLTLDRTTNFSDAAGRKTSEGYSIAVNSDGVIIAGASPLGTWWGTRTLLQAAVLNKSGIPFGSAVDAPGWGSRGVMLDAGRHYYPPGFLIEMCAYLSYFKQNTFHVHLSDQLGSSQLSNYQAMMNLYAGFRLDSDDPKLAGLAKRKNETYSRSVFDNIQKQCAARGVTIIPEIEAPGHALAITQWKPSIALTSDYTMLDISKADTIPTMKDIWHAFLPWFYCKSVHIGADEYNSSLRADYNKFVNEMNNYIHQESNKTIRIWGTFPPKKPKSNDELPLDVVMQHWAAFEDNAYMDYIKNGYDVLNSDDGMYIVTKFSRSYPQTLNKARIFSGNPAGGPFSPIVFDTKTAANNPPRNEAHVLGHIAAQWNDYGPTASVYSEAYYSWRDNLPALADKQWGGDLQQTEYDAVFNALHAAIPGQNLDRAIPSRGNTILKYDFSQLAPGSTKIPDASGNGYDGTNHGCVIDSSQGAVILDGSCYLSTPLGSKGRSYTLTFSVNASSAAGGTIFSGPDSSLIASPNSIVFAQDGNTFSVRYALPVNTWTRLRVLGKADRTFLEVTGNGTATQQLEFLGSALERGAASPQMVKIAIEAPLSRIGESFKGMIKDIELTNGA